MTNTMSVMHPDHGDLKVIWNPDEPDEVASAREQFDAMKKKGYVAYRVDRAGDKAEVMNSFDPDAKAIILAPFVAGG